MSKQKLIDQLNDAFIAIAMEKNSKAYVDYIKAINIELIDNVESLTPAKVKSIIASQTLNITDLALLFAIQNTVIELVNKPRQVKKNDNALAIVGLIGLYSITKPKQFAKRVDKIITGVGLNANEKKAKVLIDTFEQENKQTLIRARKQAIKGIEKSIRKSKISKRLLKDLKNGLDNKDSVAKIKNRMIKKYNNKANIERALDTELHRASETVRQAHSIALGYTHKTWKTQADDRVRSTCFHNGVKNKRIPIDSDFRSCGMIAQRPSDDRLPPGESIRCRCYLIYD